MRSTCWASWWISTKARPEPLGTPGSHPQTGPAPPGVGEISKTRARPGFFRLAQTRLRPTGPEAPYSGTGCWVLILLIASVEALILASPQIDLRAEWVLAHGFRDRMEGIWPLPPVEHRWISHLALHSTPRHAASNILMLLLFGWPLCRRIGWIRFAFLFLAGGIGSALLFAAMSPDQGFLIGASGGIYGLIGAGKLWEALYLKRSGGPWSRFYASLLFFVALNMLLTAVFGLPVAWQGHLGGAITGALLAPFLMRRAPPGRLVI